LIAGDAQTFEKVKDEIFDALSKRNHSEIFDTPTKEKNALEVCESPLQFMLTSI
jgi:hypothetical protein